MTMDLSQPLLEHCPFCDYALEGLPEKHACPECGQEFDRRWRVFGNKRNWYGMGGLSRLLLGAGIGVNAAFALYFGLLRIGVWPMMAMNCAAAAFGFYAVQKVPRHVVGVGPEGIMVYDRKHGRSQTIEWSRISRAVRRWDGTLVIVAGDTRMKSNIGGWREVGLCAESINRILRRAKD